MNEKYYNIEVQRSDDDDHIKRVRYNSANIDTYITEKGIEYKYLPNDERFPKICREIRVLQARR